MADFDAASIADAIIEAEGRDHALVAFIDNVRRADTSLENLTSQQLALVATFIVGEQ